MLNMALAGSKQHMNNVVSQLLCKTCKGSLRSYNIPGVLMKTAISIASCGNYTICMQCIHKHSNFH